PSTAHRLILGRPRMRHHHSPASRAVLGAMAPARISSIICVLRRHLVPTIPLWRWPCSSPGRAHDSPSTGPVRFGQARHAGARAPMLAGCPRAFGEARRHTMTADPKSHHAGDTEVLEALIEGAPDGLALLSTNGQFLLVNEAATHLLGVRREDLLSRFVADGGLGLGIEGAWVLDVLASQAAVSRTLELRGGRKAMVTMRA